MEDNHIEIVHNFITLGSIICDNADCEKEIRRRLAMGRSTMTKLAKIMKDKGISVATKPKLVYSLVCPVVFFYLPFLSSIHEKANCIAILWTGSPHSLGSCLFRGLVTYGSESWTLRKADQRRLNEF